jgi:hypothetical protein
MCTKRLPVRIRLSLIVTIIYRCTNHYNYLQAYLHQTQIYLQALVIKNRCIQTQVILKCQMH